MKFLTRIATPILLLWVFAFKALGAPSYITFPSDVHWMTQESEHFSLIYRSGNEAFAERTLRAAERAFKLLDPIFPSGPEKTHIVLGDFQDATNGYAVNFPYSHFVLFAAPPGAASQLSNLDDWLFSLVLHEYTHIRHLYPAEGLWKPMRSIFGSWVMPNGLMPGHLHEGIATFLETEFTRGGRGRSSFFSMLRRAAVEAGTWGKDFYPLDRFDGIASQFPYGTSAYFFGYQLYEELWRRKGGRGFNQLTESYASNWPYFLNGPLAEVYGPELTFASLWQKIFATGEALARVELSQIKQKPLSQLTFHTDDRYWKNDLAASPTEKYLALRTSSPHEGSYIEIRKPKPFTLIERIEENIGAAEGLCWTKFSAEEWLLYTKPVTDANYQLFAVQAYAPESKRYIQLRLTDSPLRHVHQIGCHPTESRIAVFREAGGKGEILDLAWQADGSDKAGEARVERRWPLPEGTWVSSLHYHGGILHFLLRDRMTSLLYRWAPSSSPTIVRTLATHFYALREDSSGKLLALGNIDNRTEVWSIPPQGPLTKKVALTTGLSSFTPLKDNSYLVTAFRHGGYDVASVNPGSLEQNSGEIGAATPSLSDQTSNEGVKLSAPREYSPFPSLWPKAWMPSVLFVPDGLQAGIWITGFDLAQRHHYTLIGGYDTRGLAFGEAGYEYRFGKSSWLGVNGFFAPSYINSSKSFLKRWGESISFGTQFDWFPPTVRFSALFRRVEPSRFGPGLQSVGAGIGLSYSFGAWKRPLDVTYQRGTVLTLNYEYFPKFLGSTQGYFNATLGWDQYVPAPWARGHAFYLGQRLGYTEGTFLYNSFYQGGGELLFQQGRGSFLNRGFLPGSFLARRIYNANLEYRFPIWRIERGVGLMPFHLKTIHGALVADTTSGDLGLMSGRQGSLMKLFYSSAGFELKSEWEFFSYLPSQLRLGAYHGFGPYGETLYLTFGMDSFF